MKIMKNCCNHECFCSHYKILASSISPGGFAVKAVLRVNWINIINNFSKEEKMLDYLTNLFYFYISDAEQKSYFFLFLSPAKSYSKFIFSPKNAA